MKRSWYVLLVLLAMYPARGQDTISQTKVYTDPTGAVFSVDGRQYQEPVVFTWPQGTKHVLQLQATTEVAPGIRYSCTAWNDSKQLLQTTSLTLTVIADPTITSYKGVCALEYRLLLDFFERPDQGVIPSCATTPQPPGLVLVGGVCTDHSAEFWFQAETKVNLQAQPYLDPNNASTDGQWGFVFDGWTQFYTQDQSYLTTVTMDRPIHMPVLFRVAKRVTLVTDPPGLEVLVDRQTTTTPFKVDWMDGSKHYLGAPSPQRDADGNPLLFDSWSYGGGQNSAYTANSPNNFETLTAKFVPGTAITLATQPAGLKLSVDGTSSWVGYNFTWAVGSKHQIVAAQEQTDAQGRKYVFRKWSDGADATREVVVQQGVVPDGLRTAMGYSYTATYELLGRVTVQTSPPGLIVNIDGADCRPPSVFDKVAGTTMKLAAPPWAPLIDGARWDFLYWSDGGGLAHSVTFTQDVQILTAVFRPSFRLLTLANPAAGATFRLNPSSPDGFYPQDTGVVVTAVPQPGFRFRRWDGDLTGTYNSGALIMSAPRNILALLDLVPYIAPAGVRNAAADTPEPGVAAGSVVGIFGSNLAGDFVSANTNPLPQTLGSVTVRLGDRILPLYFVSPEQINVQLPSGLDDGSYTLTVRWEGHPEVNASFTVVRNAPGLFIRSTDEHPFAIATHADGSPISTGSPARRGETVTLFGTGFGPYTRPAPDGFALPDDMDLPLVDPLVVLAGDFRLQPDWSGAALGQVGVALTRFKITDALPGASTLEVRVSINGHESNKVLLPIQ